MKQHMHRREALGTIAGSFGSIAFAALATEQAWAEAEQNPLATKQSHFKPRAKHVIFLSMRGAPSHVDTFDYKPRLNADNGKPGKYGPTLLGSPWKFAKHGTSGLIDSDAELLFGF